MFSIEGIIVGKDREFRGRVEIDTLTGLITKVSDPTGHADVVLKDELIFPGFIDLHVHAREDISHTQDYKEDFMSAGQAAISGGVVAFAEMPNNPIPPVDDEKYKEKQSLTTKSEIPIVLYAAIGPETKPLHLQVPYKAFMGKSIGDVYFTSRDQLESTLAHYEGCSVSFHCEDPKIMDENIEADTHEKRRPPQAEISAIDLAILLIEKYKLHGKICHASTMEGIQKIALAKSKGIDVTVEVTPHHLYFDETMFNDDLKKKLQVNPPIRQTKDNRLFLIESLRNGTIDYLATDHAPHTKEEKDKGISGMPHLDTYGSFTTWLMKEHGFTSSDIRRVCSHNPGNFINQFTENKYGEIKEGYIGSLTVLDIYKPELILDENMKTKCGWSPFAGLEFPGSVTMTIIEGNKYAKR